MKFLKTTFGFLTIMVIISFGSCGNNTDTDNSGFIKPQVTEPIPPKGDAVRIVSYNVGVFSKYEQGNYQTIANMMKELDADAVLMSELDSCTIRTNNVFQLKHFADLMQWEYVYGKAMPYQGGGYGEGLACKAPVLRKYAVALPKGVGAEPRVLVVAELEDYILATSHLDHVAEAARIKQVEVINQTMLEYMESGKPVFFGGDMNALPESATMQALRKHWTVITAQIFTFPSHRPSKCIDYVMQLNNGVKCKVVSSNVPRSFKAGDIATASDHLPIYVDVILPKN